MAVRHFHFGRHRKAQAEIAKPLELRVVQGMAVHDIDVVAQQAIDQLISTKRAFNMAPAASTICVNGGLGCVGGYNVAMAVPKCAYATTAKGYSKKIDELALEDTTWEVRADVADALTGAKATVVQGVSIRLLAGNCP